MVTLLSASTRALLRVLDRLSLPVDTVLERAGLTRAAIDDVDARLPAAAVDAVWVAAYALVDDPALALHVARHLTVADYPIFRYLARNSASLGAAIERVARYFAWVEPRAEFALRSTADGRVIEFRIPGLLGPVPRPPAEFSLAALLLQTRALTGVDWVPASARFPFARPPEADRYHAVFGPNVRFDQADAALAISDAAWSSPVDGADLVLGHMLEAHAEAAIAALPGPALPDAVRAAVADLLRDDLEPDVDRIARRLGMSRRSLQRRLTALGTSARAELDAERQSQARVLLLDPAIAVAEVAFLLGFSEQSAFTRAFRRWTGETPAAWRALRVG